MKRNNKGSKDVSLRNSKRNPRRNSKRQKSVRVEDQKEVKQLENDPEWYKRFPELARDVGTMYFSQPLGTPIDYGFSNIPNGDNFKPVNDDYGSVPGVLQLNWFPTLGGSSYANSAVNITAREIYSFVRHANSGARNYTAPDLMMYLLALDSLYSMYTAAVRVYGLVNQYSIVNRYTPKALIKACGWDPDDVIKNIAQLRYYIDQMAYQLGAFAIPTGMSYFDRHIWMNAGIFADSEENKCQYYSFCQTAIYKYFETPEKLDDGVASELRYVRVGTDTTVAGWYGLMSGMIEQLLNSEVMGIMSGDILKAFGTENLFTVDPIDINYVTTPVYSMEVLTQINNTTVVGPPVTDTTIVPSGVNIQNRVNFTNFTDGIYQFIWTRTGHNTTYGIAQGVTAALNKVVSVPTDNPTADDILVATRLTVSPTFTDIEGPVPAVEGMTTYVTCQYLEDIPTELVERLKVYYIGADGGLKSRYVDGNGTYSVGFAAMLSAFDWAPSIYVVRKDNGKIEGLLQDTNNYKVMTREELGNLHRVALISEFNVPQLGRLASRPYQS